MLYLLLIVPYACTPSLTKRPAIAISRTDSLYSIFASRSSAIESSKRIFKLQVYDDGRTYLAEGALLYKSPDRFRLDIVTPFGETILQLSQVGDSLVLVLPRRGAVIRGLRGEEKFMHLADSEELTSPELLGGIFGSFDMNEFAKPGSRFYRSSEKGKIMISIENGGDLFQFTIRNEDSIVTNYKKAIAGTVVREVRLEDFTSVDGILRPFKVVYRDYLGNREITAVIKKEYINRPMEDREFELNPEIIGSPQ